MRRKFDDTGQYSKWLIALLIYLLFGVVDSIILTGAPDSYSRYPKWAHSFENSLSMELKTRQSDGMLLYTDDGGTHGNFYSLTIVEGHIQLDFRLGDNSNEFGQRRPVNTIRIEEVRIDDDKWHTLTIFQSWENVKLELDYTLVFKILNQRSFVFGNILKNSDVFIGGLPPNMHMLPVMSSPLRRYTRHLAVNVRNLMYRQYPQGVTSPQLLESVGTRTNEDDHCKSKSMSSREQFVCLNDGECYSANDGPHCDCQFSDHDGRNCEIEKNDGELTFGGDEWVGYDVSMNISAAVRAKKENLTLTFKTVHGTSMLFYAGDEKSYLHLMLQDGAIIASSKFDGSDARIIRMFNSFPSQRYDDDSWHTIVLERSLQMHSEEMVAIHMTLIVDGRRDEIRQYAPELDWISNSFAYLGSIPKHNPSKEVNRVSFRGCMRKVRYDVDATRVLFVNLADQSYGGSVVKTGGDLSYSCKNPSQRSDVLSFSDTSSYLTLPRWNSLSSGSLSFHFRTTSPDGLILYHGVMQHNATDYVAFELIDSHLFLIINLGSGVVRLQTTAMKVSDGEWHHVQLDRLSRTGSVIVDAIKIDFNTPGVSANLIIDDPIFIGNVPNNSIAYPPSVWSITLQKGYTGCIKNIRLNGVSAKIAQQFESTNTTGIELGCSLSNELDICEPNPCQNFGRCSRNLNSFECDCSNTNFEGKRCEIEQTAVEVDGDESKVHVLAHTKVSQVEHIQIRFRTSSTRGVLFDTGANGKNDKITVFLNDSLLNLFLQDSLTNNTFSWGKSLSDNHWHELQVRRLGQKLLLYLDGFWSHSIYLQNPISVEIDEIGAAYSVHPSSPPPRDEHFKGFLSKLIFNGNDYLAKTKRDSALLSKSTSRESKGQRNVKTRIASISFTNSTGYVAFSSDKISSLAGSFRVQFKFQTLMRSALIFFTLPKHDYDQSFRLQIINGRLKYTYRISGQEFHTTSPKLPYRQHLSDMRWHSVLIYQDEKTNDHVLLVDNSTTTLIIDKMKKVESRMSGKLYFGSNPLGVSRPSNGYRGCISTLRINEKALDLYEDADSRMNVNRGCSGPIARCVEDACANHGRCIQLWSSIRCDCSLTAHSGDRCQNPSTTVRFDGSPSAIFYEYAPNERPTTSKDYFVFSFRTTQPNGVLIAIECAADQDYFTIFLNKGYLNAHYNLGSRDHTVSYHTRVLNDGFPHVIKISRNESSLTIQVDKLPALRYRPKKASDLVLLNMQTRISIGASFNTRHLEQRRRMLRHRRNTEIFDSYQGEVSGVNVNGLMVLDLYENGSNRIHTIGAPQTTAVSEAVSNSSEEDDELAEMMMAHSIEENPNEALIESLAPSCLSLEEQQTCFIDTDDSTGFFSPVLPAVADIPSTRPSETVTTRRTPSPKMSTIPHPITTTLPVFFLSQITDGDESEDEFDGSGDDQFGGDGVGITAATQPSVAKSTPSIPAVTKVLTTTTSAPSSTHRSTVLPRPYASVKEAAEQNPDYLGSSIWNQVDTLPEPMVTGPAWRTNKSLTTTVTTQPTTTTKKNRKTTTTATTTSSTTTTRYQPNYDIDNEVTALITSSIAPQKTRPKSTPHFTVYPVRPTTPMGDTITTTMQAATVTDFPRTPLIMGSSLAVIIAIAAVVFFVFKCRQNPPASEHYTMAMKSQSGYTAIAPELSPPMNHDRNNDSCTQPLLAKPHINGNGYEPLKGAVIANGNGATATMMRNGNGNGVAKKKDFKEWYKTMSRPWPSSSLALLSLFLIILRQSLACIDVLFVIDNKTLEVSRNRALQVARQLPENQKIRKWVVLSRNDRYVPRVLRNNAELQSVLSTIHGDYDRFLEIATGEIARRTATFQPFVILLFSETPVNQTMTKLWRSISLAPALHIYRIGSFQRTNRMLSEDQETDFEKLILCGRNRTDLFNTESSKFSGGNEIRRSPTSTPHPWTSTRDPFVRRLTFYDASRTLIEEKRKQEQLKQQQLSQINKQFTITRTFKKMTTKSQSFTRIPTTTSRTTKTTRNHISYTTRTPTKYDAKKFSGSYQASTRSTFVQTITRRPQYTTSYATARKPWWITQVPQTRLRPSITTTPSSVPAATIDSPLKKHEGGGNEIEELNGKNFKVRSRSVHFAMTEKPPVTTAMNPMKFFTTSRTPITTAKSLIPYSCTADVFFLVDLSQGTGDKSQQYLDIAASAISSLPISQEAVRVGLISYSGPGRTHVRVYLDKHNDKEKLIEEMFLMERHGGTTRTADAIRYATKIFEGMAHPARKNVKKVLVVFTDGYSQDHPRDAARGARAKGLQLIAVAVKDRLAPPDEEQLAEIGGHAKNVFISPNGRELREKIIGTQCRL
ncbi:hypothetical protein L3Y34_008113 [Caenorhabditis briggsae]|uniref:Protein CBR-NRX-1 n=1 Tax=Caenorhabditis briggsae TaxID=6238 RepID=A0AAE9D1Z4_CAEBR|nr:hypothetical protein L3Y34_008113 [Caenorhabditis briggsae]